MYRFKLLSKVTYFPPEEFPLIFPINQVCQQPILLVFMWGCLYLIFIFENYFYWMQDSIEFFFSLSTLNMSSHCHLYYF